MKIRRSYDDVSNSDVIPLSASLVYNLTSNPAIMETVISLLPNLGRLVEAHERFQASYNALLSGDHEKALTLEADREELNRRLARFAALVHLVAEDNQTAVQKAGFVIEAPKVKAKTKGRGSATVAPIPPGNFVVRHGTQHGEIVGKAVKPRGAGSFEVHICESDPTIEQNWRFIGVYLHCSRMEIKDLVPGRLYSFRVRGLWKNGPGPWSANATLMAI